MDYKGIELLRAANQELERQVTRMRAAYNLQQKEIIFWKSIVASEFPEHSMETFERNVQEVRNAHRKLNEDSGS